MPAKQARGRVAVVPGTFDPPTNGHLETIRRAVHLFDEVVVAVYAVPSKQTLFDADERLALVEAAVREAGLANVRCRQFGGRLLVDLAQEEAAVALVKGLRAVSDFDYEFQMSHMNGLLAPQIATVAVFASAEYSFLSSTLVREVAKLGGDVSRWVPAVVAQRLGERFRRPGHPGQPGWPGNAPRDAAAVPDGEGSGDRLGGFVVHDERLR